MTQVEKANTYADRSNWLLSQMVERVWEAERDVIASMLASPRDAVYAVTNLKDTDFFKEGFRVLFVAIKAILEETPDYISVMDVVTFLSSLNATASGPWEDDGHTALDVAGGEEAVIALSGTRYETRGVKYATDYLKAVGQRRLLVELCSQGQEDAMHPSIDPYETTHRLASRLLGSSPLADPPIIVGSDIFEYEVEPYLVPNLLPAGKTLLFGEEKSGKSYIAATLAYALATGTKFFNVDVPLKRVLYVAGEAADDVVLRVRTLARYTSETPVIPDALALWGRRLSLSQDGDISRLESAVQEHRADVLILDTWAQLAGLENENDMAEVQRVLNSLERIRQRTGCAIIIVHHANSQGGVRGSTALSADVDAVIGVKRDHDTRCSTVYPHRFRRGAGFPEFVIEWRNFGEDSVIRLAGHSAPLQDRSLYARVKTLVDDHKAAGTERVTWTSFARDLGLSWRERDEVQTMGLVRFVQAGSDTYVEWVT